MYSTGFGGIPNYGPGYYAPFWDEVAEKAGLKINLSGEVYTGVQYTYDQGSHAIISSQPNGLHTDTYEELTHDFETYNDGEGTTMVIDYEDYVFTDAYGNSLGYGPNGALSGGLNDDWGGDWGNANQGGLSNDDAAIYDKAWTLSSSPAIFNKGYKAAVKEAGEVTAMRVLGKVTGALSLYDDYNEYQAAKEQNNTLGETWAFTKGVAQTIFLFGGGEEVELGWNLGTMAVDGIIKIANSN